MALATAPHSAGWQRRMGNAPGPLGAPSMGGQNLPGVPFLTNSAGFAAMYPNARVMVEIAWGADPTADPTTFSFTDVTTDVMQGDSAVVSITPMGRSDASSETQPAACTFRLDNRSGKYSKGAQSSNYPYVRLNVPVRVSVNLTGSPSDTSTRFWGGAWSFKPGWDTTGNYAIVDVSAAGTMRRLQQGKTPFPSPLYRAITRAEPVAYWPLEDGDQATQALSAITGGTPLVAGATAPLFGQIEGPPGSQPLPDFTDGGSLQGSFSGATSTTSWSVDFVARFPTLTGTGAQNVLSWHTPGGTSQEWHIEAAVANDDIRVVYRDTPTTTVLFGFGILHIDTRWHHFRVTNTQSGGNQSVTVAYDGVVSAPFATAGTVAPPAGAVIINPLSIADDSFLTVGHFAVFSPANTSDINSALDGYAGETDVERITRLCGEETIQLQVTGGSDTAMGPQGPETLISILREAETTGRGVLGDGRNAGLYYITNSSRYNQPVALALDAPAGDIIPVFIPEDDDQQVLNTWQVSNKAGSTAAIVSDVTGPLGTDTIDVYDSSLTVNTETDDPLASIASWLVNIGTVDGYRYPTLGLDFTARPALAVPWLALGIGGHVQLANVSNYLSQHPPEDIELNAEGWSEVLSPLIWQVVINASPQQPYEVYQIGTGAGNRSRIPAGVSTLSVDATAAATSLTVASPTTVWIDSATYPTQFPFDIEITGERMTVTAITSATSPQTFTVTRAVNGISKAHAIGEDVQLWQPPVIAL